MVATRLEEPDDPGDTSTSMDGGASTLTVVTNGIAGIDIVNTYRFDEMNKMTITNIEAAFLIPTKITLA
ncbi:MAG: hypothetical protein JSW28_10815 [Thermoplasmata archaeon]|nr:MAG: hypothetical protein JSW28_10815 [Thermoplasmata archaeon]